jgi:hypothetical protein
MGPNNFKHLGDTSNLSSLAKGEAPTRHSPYKAVKELADITSYNSDANSYEVITRGVMGMPSMPGGRHLKDLPRKLQDEGNASTLEEGTTVIIDYSLGFPFIDGVLNLNTRRADTDNGVNRAPNMGGTSASTTVPTDESSEDIGGFYRSPGAPKNLLPGDQVLYTRDGNMVGAVRGRYCFLDAGEGSKARVEVLGDRDLVRITCEDFELNTGFGALSIYNSDGRCGLEFRAAADQLNESGGKDEQWTFKLDIGDSGEYFTLEVCDSEGATKAKLQFSADGKIDLIATNGASLVNGSKQTPLSLESAAGMVQKILGKLNMVVGGAAQESYGSTRKVTVSETDSRMVGHDDSVSVNHNQLENIGGNIERTVSGGTAINAKPLNIAISEQVLNGSYFIELGNPLLGGSPAAMAGFTVAVNNGDITLGQNPAMAALPAQRATVSLNTLLPDSVALGGTTGMSTNKALKHAVFFEPLLQVLTAMIIAHDTHVHLPPTMPPSVPSATTITPLLSTLMCLRVLLGG